MDLSEIVGMYDVKLLDSRPTAAAAADNARLVRSGTGAIGVELTSEALASGCRWWLPSWRAAHAGLIEPQAAIEGAAAKSAIETAIASSLPQVGATLVTTEPPTGVALAAMAVWVIRFLVSTG